MVCQDDVRRALSGADRTGATKYCFNSARRVAISLKYWRAMVCETTSKNPERRRIDVPL